MRTFKASTQGFGSPGWPTSSRTFTSFSVDPEMNERAYDQFEGYYLNPVTS